MARNPFVPRDAKYPARWLLVPAVITALALGSIVLLSIDTAPDATPVQAPSVEEPAALESFGA